MADTQPDNHIQRRHDFIDADEREDIRAQSNMIMFSLWPSPVLFGLFVTSMVIQRIALKHSRFRPGFPKSCRQ
jgi:hypothetical protein